MPYPAVTDEYYDDILYWGNPVDDGFGNYTFDDPVELKARWIEKTQLKLDGVTGQDVVMNVVIYAGQALDLKGYVMKGELDDLDSDGQDPLQEANARQLRQVRNLTNFRNGRSLYVGWTL